MKNFLIKIRYCGYSADFNVTCEDSAVGIEKAILDKLGKNEVKFEKNGFTSKIVNGWPMRRLQVTQDLYIQKKSLELEWQQEHLKEGKYNINMSYIDKKIQEVVKEIIAKEFEQATIQTKIEDAKSEVSIAT